MARVSGRDVDFASLRHQHIGARVPVAWLESNETSLAFSTPPARPANLKVCSVMSADMRWRWRPSMDTIFGGKSGRRVLLCFGYRLGGRAFVYRLRAAAGGDGDYRLRRIADPPDCGVWWKIVEKYQVSRMFSAPTAIRVLKNSLPLKFANTIFRRWKCSIWLENRWTSRPPVG